MEESESAEKIKSLTEQIGALETKSKEQEGRIEDLWKKIVAAEGQAGPAIEKVTQVETRSKELDEKNSSLEKLLNSLEEKLSAINKHFADYFIAPTAGEKSKRDGVIEHHTTIEKLLQGIETARKEVTDFKVFAYGDGSPENPGFKKKLEDIYSQSDETHKGLLSQQEKSFSTMFEKIEGLLPGATATGLAKSYQDQKRSYLLPVIIWSLVFIVSVGGMIAFALWKFNETRTFQESLIHILARLPFFAPAVWLALFAAKRQNQNMRLLQEYSYKETLAKSYESYKREIDKLPDGDAKNKLIEVLMAAMVKMSEYNPSLTLEHKSNEEKIPSLLSITKKQEMETEKKAQTRE